MPGPNDYISPLLQASINPAQSFSQGLQVGNQIVDNQRAAVADQRQGLMFAQAQQDRSAAIEAAKAQAIAGAQESVAESEAMTEFDANPTAIGALKNAARFPKRGEALMKIHAALAPEEQRQRVSIFTAADAALAGGSPAVAADGLRRAALAYEGTKGREEEAKPYRALADLIDNDPDGTKGRSATSRYLASVAPKEYATIATDLEKLPAVVAKEKADAKVAESKALNADRDAMLAQGLTIAQTDRLLAQTKSEAARLGLDWAKLRQDTARDNAALAAKAVELTAAEATRMGDAALEANKSRQMARQTNALAGRFLEHSKTPTLTGALGKLAEEINDFAGTPGAMTNDRNEFRGVVEKFVGQALKGGGAITDSERASIRSTMPKATDNPALIAKWLQRVEKLQDRDSRLDMAQAEFIALNGGLGNVRKPGVINGVEVAPGMTFGKYLDKIDETMGPIDVAPADADAADGFFK